MCGFIAAINFNDKKIFSSFSDLKKINRHRGPDNIKIFNGNNYSLIFRRLSIIDTSSNANQPFHNENQKISLVFNGEIYNYIELKKELIKKYEFNTNSDTEVILKSYEEWGIEFVKKLRGMFSIILFDNSLNKIFFIRDRLGQKPLYYTFVNKILIASSEIKDILFLLRKLKIPIAEEKNVVNKYLFRGWADDNNKSFFKNIFQFQAGTYTVYKNKKLSKPKSYWKLNLNLSKKFHPKLLKKKLIQNIKIHLRSDVSIATTLSGGMDSGSIVKISTKFIKNLTAFSLKNSFGDESKTIDKLINKLKINHHYINTEKLYKKNSFRDLIKSQDEPIVSASHFDQYLLRKKIKSMGFKVLLVGEGGDEVFGGYLRLVIAYICELEKKKIPSDKIFYNIKKYFGVDKKEFMLKIREFIDKQNKKNDIEDISPFLFLRDKTDISKNLRYKNPYFYKEKNIFKKCLRQQMLERDLPHIVRAEDRISMANSIENRSPFLDHELIEFILNHNTKYFVKEGIPKFMLRKSMSNILPKEYLDYKKTGRPGNEKLLLQFYTNHFIALLQKYKIDKFSNKKILSEFKTCCRKKEFKNFSNFFFRVFNYLIWKDINFN